MRTTTIQKIPAIFALLLLAACGKKGDTPKAQSNLLTASPWKAVKNEYRTTGGVWVAPPLYSSFEYYPGETATFFDGGAYSTSPGGGAGTWLMSADGKTLTLFRSTGSSVTLTVSSLTATTLQFSGALDPKDTYTVENGGTPNVTYTYYDTKRTTLTH